MTTTGPLKITRLSVNLGPGPADALRAMMESRGITATEAIRRAISIYKVIGDEQGNGWEMAFIKRNRHGGSVEMREVFFPPTL